MAGGNEDGKKMVYVRIMGGEWRVEAEEGAIKDGLAAVKRDKLDKKGAVSGSAWYFVYKTMNGYIDKIFLKYKEKISSDVLHFNQVCEDSNEIWQIQLKPGSDYAKNLINRMLHSDYDPSKEVRLKVYDFTDEKSKRKCGISVYQHSEGIANDWGVKIEGFYNQDNPDDKSPAWDEKFRKDEKGMAIWKIEMDAHAKDLIAKAVEGVIPFKPMVGDKPMDFTPPPPANDSVKTGADTPPSDEETDLPF